MTDKKRDEDRDELRIALADRATRGRARGAGDVWDAANAELMRQSEHRVVSARAGMWLSVAAVTLLVAAGGWWLAARDDRTGTATADPADTSQPVDVTPTLVVPSDPDGEGQNPEPGRDPGDGDSDGGQFDGSATTTVTGPGDPSADDPEDQTDDTGGGDVDLDVPLAVEVYGLSRRAEAQGSVDAGWTVELEPGDEPGDSGGAVVSSGPHTAVDGRLVVEFSYAAVIEGRGDSAWGEVVVTPAATLGESLSIFAVNQFGGDPALGCRLQAGATMVCSLFGPDGDRIWQVSYFESAADDNQSVYDPDAWTTCEAGRDPRTCLDRFRMELTADSIAVWTNDQIQILQRGLPPLPPELLDGPITVHASSSYSRHPDPLVTYDWGPVVVNPVQ